MWQTGQGTRFCGRYRSCGLTQTSVDDDNRTRLLLPVSPTAGMYQPLTDDETKPKGCVPDPTWEDPIAWKQGDRRGRGGYAYSFQGASRTRCDLAAIGGGDLLSAL